MLPQDNKKTCKVCGTEFKMYRSTDKYCSYKCANSVKKPNLKLKKINPIPKVSKKRKIENAKYSVLRIEFLSKPENKICPITE